MRQMTKNKFPLKCLTTVNQKFECGRRLLTKSNPTTTSGKSFCSWIVSFTAALTLDTDRDLKKAHYKKYSNQQRQ